MSTLFNKCIAVVLLHEGGFQKNPNDKGNWVGGYKVGKLVGTKYGIAAKFFPNEDIPNLTIERAIELYYLYYWTLMNLEGICREASALEIFDFGVNAGKRRSVARAQELVGVKKDGICGPMTTFAINNYSGDFVEDFKDVRRMYYISIAKGDNEVFLNGWLNRVTTTHFK